MSGNEIYSRFIAWLDKGWWHLPTSGHEHARTILLKRNDRRVKSRLHPFINFPPSWLSTSRFLTIQSKIGGSFMNIVYMQEPLNLL